jgi:hypothetical protein
MLSKNGHIIYNGPRAQCQQYLETIGLFFPGYERYSLVEWLVEITSPTSAALQVARESQLKNQNQQQPHDLVEVVAIEEEKTVQRRHEMDFETAWENRNTEQQPLVEVTLSESVVAPDLPSAKLNLKVVGARPRTSNFLRALYILTVFRTRRNYTSARCLLPRLVSFTSQCFKKSNL